MPPRSPRSPVPAKRPRLPLLGLASLAIMGGGGLTALADPNGLASLNAGLRALQQFGPIQSHPGPIVVRAGESMAAALLRAGANPTDARDTAVLLTGLSRSSGPRPLTLEATLADGPEGRLTRLVVRGPGSIMVLRRGFDGRLRTAPQQD
jgi:hypothetical protein